MPPPRCWPASVWCACWSPAACPIRRRRVDSVKIAVAKAAEMAASAGIADSPVRGSVMASDAFFPFADGLEAGIAAGITAVIQPGGSRRDDEVIAAADKAGIAMVFTGTRHFRH